MNRSRRQLQIGSATLRAAHLSICEFTPRTVQRLHKRISRARPVLNFVTARVRIRPGDPHRADLLDRAEIDHYPCRMLCVRLAREFLAEIRIALPVGVRVAVRQSRIVALGASIARVATMRQRISIGMAQKLRRRRASSEVTALMRGVAPRSSRIPVPCGNLQFRVLAVGDRTPSSGKRFLQNLRRVDLIDNTFRKNVDGGAQRTIGNEGVSMRRIGIDVESGRCVLGNE